MSPILLSAAGNPQNQDRGLVVLDGPRSVLCVADGAGGRSGGAEAAQMAVDFVRANMASIRDADSCAELLRKMDAALCADSVAGETTCVVAVADQKIVFGASVGDSGAWLIRDRQSILDLTRSQQRKPFIGTGAAWPMPFKQARAGELLLLATDGLLKYNSVERIVEISLKDPAETAAQHLVQSVRYPSGNLPDDVTLILAPAT